MIGPLAALAFIVVANNQPFSLKRSSCDFVECVTVECVMSMNTIGRQKAISISALARTVNMVGFEPDNIPANEQIALLKCKGWDRFAKLLYDEMIARGVLHPRRDDFAKLIEKQLVKLDPASGYHRLRPLGKSAVDTMIMRRFGSKAVHQVTQDAGGNGRAVGLKCTCGWRTIVHLRGVELEPNIQAAVTNHIQTQERIAEMFGAMAARKMEAT